MIKRVLRVLIAGCLSGLIILSPGLGGCVKAEAATLSQTLIYGALAFAYVNGQLNNLNDNHQDDLLKQTQRQTGVYHDEAKEAYVNNVARRLMANGLINNHYAVYITPDKKFNAFCTLGRVIAVNRGTIETLDEDELASVLAHEMGHGEHKDPVEGTKKILGMSLIINLYLMNNSNTTSNVLGLAAGNYIANEVITMKEEWSADNAGFDNAVAAGYNPGGGAAAMVKLRATLGELWNEGLSQIVSPNNHPKTTDRVNNFASRITAYSSGHITVKNDKTVQIDGQDVVAPKKTAAYLAEERTYLIAGNLARVYHANVLGPAYIGDDGAVYIGNQRIMASEDEDGQSIVDRINAITGK